MRNSISKFITAICEKNYSQADSLLKDILTEKVKQKIKKVIKDKDNCCSGCKKNSKNVSKKGK